MADHKDGFSDVMGLLENNFPGDETPSVPEHEHEHEHEHDYKANYRFSVGQLPSWAKKQVGEAAAMVQGLMFTTHFMFVLVDSGVCVTYVLTDSGVCVTRVWTDSGVCVTHVLTDSGVCVSPMC